MVPAAAKEGFFSRLGRLGVTPDLDPLSAKRVVLSNKTAIGICLLAFASCPAVAIMGIPELAWACVLSGLGYLLVPLFSSAGWPKFSRLYHVTFTNVIVLAVCWYFGRESGFYFHFLSPFLVPLMLLGSHERKLLIFSFSLTAACLIALAALGLMGIERSPLSPETAHLVFFFNLIAAMAINAFRIWSFFLGTAETEKALSEAVEAARAADKAKSSFLANMSHEIRTPLNGILGLSDLMSRSDLPPVHRENVDSIRSSAFDLLGIINEILDLSKIEAGKMRLEYAVFELRKLLEALRHLYLPQADRKGLEFTVEVDREIPDRLVGDPVRVKQVLNNLLGNAFKFTNQGRVALRVRATAPVVTNAPIEFEVEDTGVGIPEDAQPLLFHPFSQADGTTTRKYGGTGLGLHLCRQMVEMMGGEIGFRSGQGRGSRFHFSLTLGFAHEKSEEEREEGGAAPARLVATLARKRILLVDDQAINRRVLEAMLECHGAPNPVKAGDGSEALEMFAREPFDLVFMDSHMPRMDGYECTRRMREAAEAEGLRPVIIGVTADAMAGSREKCLQAGMDDMITKPILDGDLARVLTHWFAPPEGAQPGNMDAFAVPQAGHGGARGAQDWVDVQQVGEMNAWIRQYNPGYWDKTLTQFESSFRRLSASIRNACEAGRFHEARESAHALRGVCVMLGMRRMAETCMSLETLGQGEKTMDWPDILGNLEAERAPTLEELRKWIG